MQDTLLVCICFVVECFLSLWVSTHCMYVLGRELCSCCVLVSVWRGVRVRWCSCGAQRTPLWAGPHLSTLFEKAALHLCTSQAGRLWASEKSHRHLSFLSLVLLWCHQARLLLEFGDLNSGCWACVVTSTFTVCSLPRPSYFLKTCVSLFLLSIWTISFTVMAAALLLCVVLEAEPQPSGCWASGQFLMSTLVLPCP